LRLKTAAKVEPLAARPDQRQRALPVVAVPPDGLSAGGGVPSTAVDPGVPLGPGLLATCPVFRGPDRTIANTRTKAATMAASVTPRLAPSCFGSGMVFSALDDRKGGPFLYD
jgi:hypothetical protein